MGPGARVDHQQDMPLICAWAALDTSMDRSEARERTLDLLLDAGADIE